MRKSLHGFERHLLADVVVTKTEQTNNTSPSRNDLAGQLAAAVLPVRTEAEGRCDNSKANSVAQDDRVVRVLPRLVLSLLLLSGGAVTDLLGGIFDLLLALLTSGLSVGLYGLRFVVGGDGRDVRAVNVDKRGNGVLGVLDLWDSGGATAFSSVLELR
jgi:hypothetical protein